jgi:hypothetical protein
MKKRGPRAGSAKRVSAIEAARKVVRDYRQQIASGRSPTRRAVAQARRAYLLIGGDPDRPTFSLKDYDHKRYGPFLGVSDEGSAVEAIRDAAYASPKCLAVSARSKLTPDVVGVAIDAERLGGIGEVAVGPDEYADVWTGAVDRLLITTNIGTRINLRVYRRAPRVFLTNNTRTTIAAAKVAIAEAFAPFVNTPDGKPRPLTVSVHIPQRATMSRQKKLLALRELVRYVASGEAGGSRNCPPCQSLGLSAWVSPGLRGRDESLQAIDLAADAGMNVVIIDGPKRKQAHAAISFAGLLEYFPPGIVGPMLRHAKQRRVTIRAANLPDTDTIARSIWSGLHTARSMGAHLGKYGTFPLTLAETDRVVAQVQNWFKDWSAAPVLFLDQGVLRDAAVDVGHDLERGAKIWLKMVAKHHVPIVLLDTIDKSSGQRLVKTSAQDPLGCFSWGQIDRIETHARARRIKVLWAGGLGLRDAFEMGKRGVFGVYVTSATAVAISLPESYARDPMLASVKEPSPAAVLCAKILIEAGFLISRSTEQTAHRLKTLAETLIGTVESKNDTAVSTHSRALSMACVKAWRLHWKAPLSKSFSPQIRHRRRSEP